MAHCCCALTALPLDLDPTAKFVVRSVRCRATAYSYRFSEMIMHAIVLAYLLPTVLPQDKDYSVDSHTISCGFSCTKTAQFDIKLTSQDDPVTVICSGHNDTLSCKECCTLMAFVEEIDVNRATGLSPANGVCTCCFLMDPC
ncbi:unnamed protein product [Nippostrongylus brasiliensis]|uniref:Phospholipid scramblase n=1 Tax=Nippostrongylus brasiliensis TaxID=27835 RepID=A0A158R0K1_NIPBR|nr:unnamed protein product [Nippostrongylus brasiliensis]